MSTSILFSLQLCFLNAQWCDDRRLVIHFRLRSCHFGPSESWPPSSISLKPLLSPSSEHSALCLRCTLYHRHVLRPRAFFSIGVSFAGWKQGSSAGIRSGHVGIRSDPCRLVLNHEELTEGRKTCISTSRRYTGIQDHVFAAERCIRLLGECAIGNSSVGQTKQSLSLQLGTRGMAKHSQTHNRAYHDNVERKPPRLLDAGARMVPPTSI